MLVIASCVLASVVLVGGGYLLYDWLVSPAVPDLRVATAAEVAEFLAHPRGLIRLPQEQRCRFLSSLLQGYRDSARRRELVGYLRTLPSEQKQQVREAVFAVVADEFFAQVDRFYAAPESARDEIIDQSLARLGMFVAGLRGSSPETDLTLGMREGLPTDSAGWLAFVVGRTRAVDRARARPFIEGVQRRLRELKSSPRAREQFAKNTRRFRQG